MDDNRTSTDGSHPRPGRVTPMQQDTNLFTVLSCPTSPYLSNSRGTFRGKIDGNNKNFNKEVSDLKKENFSLKLQMCLLQQKFSGPSDQVAEIVDNVVCHQVQLQSLQDELANKVEMLEKTWAIAKQKEAACKEAEAKVAALEEQIANMKENPLFEKCCPEGDASSKKSALSSPYVEDINFFEEGVHNPQELIQKLKESLGAVKLVSKKKSLTILNLMKKFKETYKHQDERLWSALNQGLESAKNRDIQNVIRSINQIKLGFCEHLNMKPEELLQGDSCKEEELTRDLVIKQKKIEELEEKLSCCQGQVQTLEKSMVERLKLAKQRCDELELSLKDMKQKFQKQNDICESLEKDLSVKEKGISDLRNALDAKTNALEFAYKGREELMAAISEKTSKLEFVQQVNQQLHAEVNFLSKELEKYKEIASKVSMEESSKNRTHFTMRSFSQTSFDSHTAEMEGDQKSVPTPDLSQQSVIGSLTNEIERLNLEVKWKDMDIDSLKSQITNLHSKLDKAVYHKAEDNMFNSPEILSQSDLEASLLTSVSRRSSDVTLPTYSQYWANITSSKKDAVQNWKRC